MPETLVAELCQLIAVTRHQAAVAVNATLAVLNGRVGPEYKCQMELYLRWMARYEREEDESMPLGIILCAGARQVELLELDSAGIHVAEYLTALPSREALQRKLQDAIATAKQRFKPGDSESGAS